MNYITFDFDKSYLKRSVGLLDFLTDIEFDFSVRFFNNSAVSVSVNLAFCTVEHFKQVILGKFPFLNIADISVNGE